MGLSMRVGGRITLSMVAVCITMQLAVDLKENLQMVQGMELAFEFGHMAEQRHASVVTHCDL